MKRSLNLSGVYFCGNKASDYAIEQGFLDYATLAKAFDAVLQNNIMSVEPDYWEIENGMVDNSDEIDALREELDELESGKNYATDESGNTYIYFVDDDGNEITGDAAEKIDARISELEEQIEELEYDQENKPEIFQYYIISGAGAEILEDYTDEIVYYNSVLDMYVWGVTHWGTSWDYVLTDIPLNCKEA